MKFFKNFLHKIFGAKNSVKDEQTEKLNWIVSRIENLLIQSQPTKHQPNYPLLNDEYNNPIKSFNIQNSSYSSEVTFNLISNDEIDESWMQIPLSKNNKNDFNHLLLGLIGGSSNIGIYSLATRGLYKATADPKTLMQLSSGGVGSAVTEGGKITGHAGFVSAGSTIFVPLVVFQLASIATGQYYMNTITKQLNTIQQKLDEILKLFHIERQAKLKKSFQLLKDFSSRKAFEVEDFVLLKQILSELVDIREEYYLMLSNIKDDYFQEGLSHISSKKIAQKLSENFEKSGFFYKLNSSLTADEMYHLGKMIEFYMNLCSKDPSINRINRINEISDEIRSYKNQDFMYIKTKKIYSQIKKNLIARLNEARDNAIFKEQEIKDMIKSYKNMFDKFEKEKNKRFKSLNDKYLEITRPLEKKNEILIDNRNESPVLYIKS